MDATKATRIEPLTLTQNTAVGRKPGKSTDWYLYPMFAAGVTYYEAAPAGAACRVARSPAEFVCAVTPPAFMVGNSEQCREEIGNAVLKHAADLKLINLESL